MNLQNNLPLFAAANWHVLLNDSIRFSQALYSYVYLSLLRESESKVSFFTCSEFGVGHYVVLLGIQKSV